MADISTIGPMEQLTGLITATLQPAFASFPAHDAEGNVVGVPVLSFFAETTQVWPTIVCRLHFSAHKHSAIGNISGWQSTQGLAVAPALGSSIGQPQPAPAGTQYQTVIDPGATLEMRIGARNEVERERLVDWCYRALMFAAPVGVLDYLGAYGVNVQGLQQEPTLPDIDPSAPRPQGMPPWPAQLFWAVQAEYTVTYAPLPATVDVVPAVVAVDALS